MQKPLVFRAPGPYFKAPILPNDAAIAIRSLRAFLGADCIKAATEAYRATESQIGGLRSIRLREQQPLLESFALFDKLTLYGGRNLKHVPEDLSELANTAALARAVVPTLNSASAKEHRECLLSLNGRLRPLLLEWKSAAQLIKSHSTEIAWLPSRGKNIPEFVARAGNVEFEIECKLQTSMITQVLGDSEADGFASEVVEFIRSAGLQGTLVIEVPASEITTTGALQTHLLRDLTRYIAVGDIRVDLAGGTVLHGNLRPNDGVRKDKRFQNKSVDEEKCKHHNARVYSTAENSGGSVSNIITVALCSPIKDVAALSADLWEKKFKKAAEQCTGTRGAILVFEWDGIEEPEIFTEPNVLQQLMSSTFLQFPYVARIVMRCVNAPIHGEGQIHFHTRAYTVENEATSFPEVRKFMALDEPL